MARGLPSFVRSSTFRLSLFYVLLFVSGLSIDDARETRLLLPRVALHPIRIPELHLPASLAHGSVDWSAIGAHLPETFVVTSIAAITILMNSTAIGAASRA